MHVLKDCGVSDVVLFLIAAHSSLMQVHTFNPALSKSRDVYGLLISCKATVFWRDAVEPKYPWRDQTSLIRRLSVPKRYD